MISSDLESHHSLLMKMVEEVNNFVSSIEGETILVCGSLVSTALMVHHSYTPSFEKNRPLINNVYLQGYFDGRELYTNFNISDGDYRLIVRYGEKTEREIKLKNLLEDKSNIIEFYLDLSHHYIILAI